METTIQLNLFSTPAVPVDTIETPYLTREQFQTAFSEYDDFATDVRFQEKELANKQEALRLQRYALDLSAARVADMIGKELDADDLMMIFTMTS